MEKEATRRCPICGEALVPYRECRLWVDTHPLAPLIDHELLAVDVYLCPACRRLEWYAPISPIEAHEREQSALEAITDPVKKFEYRFRDYDEKKLQQVIDGKDYLPEAKRAAKNLLWRQKYEI